MKNMLPDTLVVTATLGNRNTLDKTIQSVKEIGGDRVKHILTSPAEKIDVLKAKFPNLEIIPEPNDCKGIYPALNNAIKTYAKDYKYVTFINDDDYWLPDFIKLFEIMDKNNEIEVVYGRTVYVSAEGRTIGEQTSSGRYKAFKALLTKNIILFTQQATLMKSDLFFRVGGFDENYKLVADTKFWAQAIDTGARFYYKNAVCAAYTIQDGQLSSDKTLQSNELQLLNEPMFIFVKGNAKFETFLFRLNNIKIYMTRFLKFKKHAF